jgi:hypothetical protein
MTMSNAIERFYALIEMSRVIKQRPVVNKCKDGSITHSFSHESIWTDKQFDEIKKELVECIKEIKESKNDNQSGDL